MDATPVPVAGVTAVGHDAIAISFETPADFAARPGQFVKLLKTIDGEEESRFYTISSPTTESTFEITVAVDSDGDFSPGLRDLDPGTEVRLSGPYGNAYYEDEDRVLLIAGGPGVGPAVGIAERALADGGEAAIIYRDDEPIHRARLDGLADAGATVRLLTEDEEMTDEIADGLVPGTQVFVYGFAGFLDDATAAIEAAGGEPDAAKVENFG